LFDFLKKARHEDPVLGALEHRGGKWRGHVELPTGAEDEVPLTIAGPRSGPDPAALALARGVPALWAASRATVECELFAHFEPYAEVVAQEAGESPEAAALAAIREPAALWPYVRIAWVEVVPLDGMLTVEVALHTEWDEEHTLGARFRDGAFVELNGSVIPS